MILVYLQDLPQFTPANWQSCQTLGRFLLRKVMTKSFIVSVPGLVSYRSILKPPGKKINMFYSFEPFDAD